LLDTRVNPKILEIDSYFKVVPSKRSSFLLNKSFAELFSGFSFFCFDNLPLDERVIQKMTLFI
jgi:hypothetical protein